MSEVSGHRVEGGARERGEWIAQLYLWLFKITKMASTDI